MADESETWWHSWGRGLVNKIKLAGLEIVYCVTSAENDIFPLSAKVTTRAKRVWYLHEMEIVFCICSTRYFL